MIEWAPSARVAVVRSQVPPARRQVPSRVAPSRRVTVPVAVVVSVATATVSRTTPAYGAGSAELVTLVVVRARTTWRRVALSDAPKEPSPPG